MSVCNRRPVGAQPLTMVAWVVQLRVGGCNAGTRWVVTSGRLQYAWRIIRARPAELQSEMRPHLARGHIWASIWGLVGARLGFR